MEITRQEWIDYFLKRAKNQIREQPEGNDITRVKDQIREQLAAIDITLTDEETKYVASKLNEINADGLWDEEPKKNTQQAPKKKPTMQQAHIQVAVELFSFRSALIKAGFTKNEAIELCGQFLQASIMSANARPNRVNIPMVIR